MFQIELPSNLYRTELIVDAYDPSYVYLQLAVDEYVVSWLQSNTPTYKLINDNRNKIAQFQNINDLILFKLTFDVPNITDYC